ncbi:Vacuolar protein-sorting-associated protein 27 [Boothiomyces sp. JEL0866]|nr:Vacuolar protein-sorting-associated protein 27 [Boothiomyces sp. JEL0866]
MNLFANPADEDIEKATSENLPIGTEDLATNLDIADKVKSGKITPKNYVASIKKRINHKNPNVTLLALKLTDTCVKNSGKLLLQEVTSRDFVDNLVSLVRQLNTHEQVRKKALELIQTWAVAFKGRSEFVIVCETYDMLRREDPVRVCDTCHYKITSKTGDVVTTPVKLNKPARVDSDDDEDLAKAIAESLELAKKSTSLPRPREEKPKHKSNEDEDLERAIQESLREAERQERMQQPKPKQETRYEEPKVEAKVGGLTESQIESIRVFCDLVEKADRDAQQGGFGNLNPIPLQTMFAKVSSLHRPLVDSLSEAADKYKALYDLNSELTSVIKDYDVLLQQRLQYSQSVSGGFSNPNPQYGYNPYGNLKITVGNYPPPINQGPPVASYPGAPVNQPYQAAGGTNPAPIGGQQFPPQNVYNTNHPSQYPTQPINPSQPAAAQQFNAAQNSANQHFSPSQPPANVAQYSQSPPPHQQTVQTQPPTNQFSPSQPPSGQFVPSQPPNGEYAPSQPNTYAPSQPNTQYAPSQPNTQYPPQPNQFNENPSQPYNPNGQHYQAYPSQPGYPNQPNFQPNQTQQPPSPAKPQEAPASDWDVNSFLWTGRLRIISVGDDCALHLEDNTTGELFAKCPVTEGAVEPVLDSSRYFVIKVVSPTGQYAYVGLGFQERSFAFDMNVALQDHQKRARNKGVVQEQPKFETIDYSLKEGQKIEINLSGFKKEKKDEEGDFSKFVIAPPPAAKKWDDFGEFKSDTNGWTSFE